MIGVAFAVVDDPAVDTGLAIADSEVRAALAAVGGAPRGRDRNLPVTLTNDDAARQYSRP